MSDGCWVQFWDHDGFQIPATEDNLNPPHNPTIRFDAEKGRLEVNDLDRYRQSDGDKAGNEADSLKTGSRAWLTVYKDKDYKGPSKSFGPNSEISDLDAVGMGGCISSFKLTDVAPPGFVEAGVALEVDDSVINAQTVNALLRGVVVAGIGELPVLGGVVGAVVDTLWPDIDNRDQVWGACQNYLNQAIAGVYWQLTDEYLKSTLTSLYDAAEAFVRTGPADPDYKAQRFANLLDRVNGAEPFFIDKAAPERRYLYLAPYATLRLATLREELQHYDAYYKQPASPEQLERLKQELRASIELYGQLLIEARDRILNARKQQITIREFGISNTPYVVDQYNGYAQQVEDREREFRMSQYEDGVLNRLALILDTHNAVGQLWKSFDLDASGPVEPPVLEYAMGPYGWYQKVPEFSQVVKGGKLTELSIWTGTLVDSLEVSLDGVSQGRVGAKGEGGKQSLKLAEGEQIVSASGYQTGLINALKFTTSQGRVLEGGRDEGVATRRFVVPQPEGILNPRLTGLSGLAGVGSGGDENIKALTFYWRCELPSQTLPAKRRELEQAG